ncbi:MAG: hypothetical protein QGD94_06860, partial [Planctomycetia bacterium]|nr:hypothetical protein [Planctomycetia bacterium]
MVQAKSMSAKLIGEAIVLVLLWTSFLAVLALEKQFSREQANPLGVRGLFSSKPVTPGYARIWIAPLPHVPWYVVTFTVLFALAAWIDFKGWRVPLCAVAGVLSAGLIAGALELSGIEKLLFLLTRCAAAAFLLSIFLMARERFGERFLLVIAGIVVVTATSPFWTSYVGQTNLWTSRIDRFSSAVTVLFPMWVCIVVLSFSERGEFLRRSTQQLSRKQLVSDVRRLVKTPSFWIAAVLVGQSSLWWRSSLGISWQASNLVRTVTASRAVSIGTFVAVLTISVLLTLWLVKKGRIRLAL